MDLQSATVLVVDDFVDNRDLLARRLRRQGHRVLMAEDGQEALDVMRRQLPDIVLLDIMMPRMNGYQLLEVMRDDEVLRHLPVIVISALDEFDSVIRCIELGAEDYLGKPFNSVLLQARIDAILEKKRLRDQERAYTEELEQLYEAVQAATEAKNNALRFVVHELRNSLTAIRGHTELVLRAGAGMPADMLVGSMQVVAEGAERINTLVADLADVSLIESGRIHLRLEAVSVAEAVDEVARAMRQPMAAKGQRLEVQVPEGLPPVRADHTRLVQVLANLVSNAHKYTLQAGTIRVWALGPESAAGRKGRVRLAVQDAGIGIRTQDQPKIFEQFYRTRYLEAQDVPGTGLGLHITRQLVEMQGGEIWFESEYRRGSTFYVVLPVAD